jgi:hypothetical protein
MNWTSRIAAAAGRGAMRLVPADRRDWAEAVWAEAREAPAGWPRLAWRAGGLGLIVKEGQMACTIGSWFGVDTGTTEQPLAVRMILKLLAPAAWQPFGWRIHPYQRVALSFRK